MPKFTLPANFSLPEYCRCVIREALLRALARTVYALLRKPLDEPVPDNPRVRKRAPFVYPAVRAALDQIQSVLFQNAQELVFKDAAQAFPPLSDKALRTIEILVLSSGHWIDVTTEPSHTHRPDRVSLYAIPATFIRMRDGVELAMYTELGIYNSEPSKDL